MTSEKKKSWSRTSNIGQGHHLVSEHLVSGWCNEVINYIIVLLYFIISRLVKRIVKMLIVCAIASVRSKSVGRVQLLSACTDGQRASACGSHCEECVVFYARVN